MAFSLVQQRMVKFSFSFMQLSFEEQKLNDIQFHLVANQPCIVYTPTCTGGCWADGGHISVSLATELAGDGVKVGRRNTELCSATDKGRIQ